MTLRTALVALALTAVPASAQAASACLNLITQNALHFGNNDPGTKSQKLSGLNSLINDYKWTSSQPRVLAIAMQEVMQGTASYNPWSSSSTPKFITTHLWSVNSYAEAYGFILDKNFSKQGSYVDFAWDLEDVDSSIIGNFVRPPGAVLVTCGDGTNPDENVWLVNIHITWGSGAAARNDETEAMAEAIEAYLGCAVDSSNPGSCTMSGSPGAWSANNAIVSGDWNRNKNQINTRLCGNISGTYTCEVFLNDKTSINRSTANYASPYDHFVSVYKTVDPMPTAATRQGPSDYGQTSLRNYVDRVSDHMGVENGVDL